MSLVSIFDGFVCKQGKKNFTKAAEDGKALQEHCIFR